MNYFLRTRVAEDKPTQEVKAYDQANGLCGRGCRAPKQCQIGGSVDIARTDQEHHGRSSEDDEAGTDNKPGSSGDAKEHSQCRDTNPGSLYRAPEEIGSADQGRKSDLHRRRNRSTLGGVWRVE